MTKRKDPKDYKKRGRPAERVADKVDLRLVAVLTEKGFTDKDLAEALDLDERSINRYKKDPEFQSVLKKGKDLADARVVRSLFERAIGYSHPEDKIFCEKGRVTIVPTVHRYPPDTVAAIFWLKNRDPENWKDRMEHTGPNGKPVELKMKINLAKASNDELLRYLQAKAR